MGYDYIRSVTCVDKKTYDNYIKDALKYVKEAAGNYNNYIIIKEYSMLTDEFKSTFTNSSESEKIKDFIALYPEKIECVMIDMENDALYQSPDLRLFYEIIQDLEKKNDPTVALNYARIRNDYDTFDGATDVGYMLFEGLGFEVNIITPLD